MQKILLSLAIVLLTLVGCKPEHPDWSEHRTQDEARASVLLDESRAALEAKDYAKAEALLDSMRTSCPLAFDARKQGIPLADSIVLAQLRAELTAQDSLMQAGAIKNDADSERRYEELCNKIKFYIRKLTHDTK